MASSRTHIKSRPKLLQSNNKWTYAMSFKHVYKGEKLQENEIVTLCCRNTHCIRLCYKEYKEEDLLYSLFSEHAGQEIPFMCRWLYHFVMEVYNRHFARIGFNYLALKGLDLDTWAECIKDGR